MRRWFVEQDLIEGVIYLPENLFYNTTAPGVILVLNKAKPKERQGKLFLLNATNEFTKGDPKNYLADAAVTCIADTFNAWKEVEKYSRIVGRDEIAKNDFNISPSRYVHTGASEEYRPIAEIVEELEAIEEEAAATDAALKKVLARIGARTALSARTTNDPQHADRLSALPAHEEKTRASSRGRDPEDRRGMRGAGLGRVRGESRHAGGSCSGAPFCRSDSDRAADTHHRRGT